LVALLMIAFATAYRLWRLDRPRRWDIVVLAGASLVYLAVAGIFFGKLEFIVGGLFHIGAVVIAGWVLAMLERRWVLEKRTTAQSV